MESINSLSELKKAYSDYKNKNYEFGQYATIEQIQSAFSNGKIFVFVGGFVLFKLAIYTFCLALTFLVVLGLGSFPSYAIMTSSFWVIFGLLLISMGILMQRWFLVIGPTGVYYRRFFKINFFQWDDVKFIDAAAGRVTRPRHPPPVYTAEVTFLLSNGKKVRFKSISYRNSEFPKFPKRAKDEMFILLLSLYSKNLYF
ncbi:MAG: hypothetical protein HWN80_19210 [Candidatus Lokiarchaeota archaeon]|nr:hypothetical protein [Candidatus Lokiarchaeota archaeon]